MSRRLRLPLVSSALLDAAPLAAAPVQWAAAGRNDRWSNNRNGGTAAVLHDFWSRVGWWRIGGWRRPAARRNGLAEVVRRGVRGCVVGWKRPLTAPPTEALPAPGRLALRRR